MMVRSAAVFAALLAGATAANADDETPPVVRGQTYVQHQIMAARAKYPQILAITVIGKRPEDKEPVVLGSTASVASVLRPAAEPTDGAAPVGSRYIVREPLLSSSNHRLGTIEIAFAARAGQEARDDRIAKAVQQGMAHATLSAKNAADPYPFDRAFAPDRFAQRLTEKTVAAHPDLLVMMIHATPPGGARNIIIGSNIGRFGKPADEDDLRVIEKGSTNLEVGGDDKDRFETELPLLDRSGQRIGALGLVFALTAGSDKEALHKHGLAIRDELARDIPNSAALFRRVK